jgi:hypothetical protein
MKRLLINTALAGVLMLSACEAFEPPGQIDTGEKQDGATNFEYGAEGSISPFHQEAPQYNGMTAVRMLYPVTVPGADGKPEVLRDAQGNATYIVAEWISGKEADNALVEVRTPDGNVVSYDAAGLRAFDGQNIQADLRAALAANASEFWQGLADTAKDGLVQGLCAALTGGLCSATSGL